MIKNLTFKEVCNFLKEDDGNLIEVIDKLLGTAIVFSPVLIGPHALPLLGLISTKNELTKLGKSLIKKVTSKEESDYLARAERMQIAYGLICFTAFFEALDRTIPDDFRKKIELSNNEKNNLAEQASRQLTKIKNENLSNYEYLQNGILDEPLQFPHPIVPFDEEAEQLVRLYSQMAQGLSEFVKKLTFWETADEEARARIKKMIKELPGKALEYFKSQYLELARIYHDFCVWSQLYEHKTTQGKLKDVSTYLKSYASLLVESEKKIDIGFNKLQKTIKTIPDRFKEVEAANIVEGLKRHYEARINDPIIEDDYESDDGKTALNFPKISEAFVPQSYRVLRQTKNDRHLEREETWINLDTKHDLGPFLINYLSSPYSIKTPLLILGHPGSGKSVLTKVLSAKLMSELYTPIRVPLREVNADLPTEEKIEYIIHRTTGNRIRSWANFSSQFTDRPLVIILDGYDELLQASGKVYAGYLKEVQQFQKREAEQGRPVRVIVTSRITLIDKTKIPEGSTVLRLMEFNEKQRNTFINIWNKANEQYFNSCEPPIQPFELPIDSKKGKADKILLLAEQPLLLLMLALYDSDGNRLRQHKGLDRTLLYDSLLRRFVERERRRYVQEFDQLDQHEQDEETEREMVRLGAVAVGMYNRRQLYILSTELDSDLKFFQLERKITVEDGRPMTQADLLLGSFFFIHKSKAGHPSGEDLHNEGNTAFEFLHNTFGEFLTAYFILKFAFQETESLQTLKRNLRGEFQRKIQAPDGLVKEWFACLMYAPLYSRPEVLEMLREWASHVLLNKDRSRKDFLDCLDEILQSQIGMILKARILPSMLQNSNATQFANFPLLGHIAVYTLNLIILRTVLDKNDFTFDEDCYCPEEEEGNPDISETRPWDKLAYIWRSWFPLDNLNGFSAILVARREGSKIILTSREKFRINPSDDRLETVLNVASTLADNITSGLAGLFSRNSSGYEKHYLVEIEKQLEAENIFLRFEFIVQNLRHFLLNGSGDTKNCDQLVTEGFREALNGRQRSILLVEFFDLVIKALQLKCLSMRCEMELIDRTILHPGYFREMAARGPEVTLKWLHLLRKIGDRRWFRRFDYQLFDQELNAVNYIETMEGQFDFFDRTMHSKYIMEMIEGRPELALEFIHLVKEVGDKRWIRRFSEDFLERVTNTSYFKEVMESRPEVAINWFRLSLEVNNRRINEFFGEEFLGRVMHQSYFKEMLEIRPEVAIELIRLARKLKHNRWFEILSEEFFKHAIHPKYLFELIMRHPEVAIELIRLTQLVSNKYWVDRLMEKLFEHPSHPGYYREIMKKQPLIIFELIRMARKSGNTDWVKKFYNDFSQLIRINLGIMPLEYIRDIVWFSEITCNNILMKKIQSYVGYLEKSQTLMR